MTTAFVLIAARPDALVELGERLAEIDGVAEVYSVTGEWDFVVIVRIAPSADLAHVVTGGIAGADGVTRTQTMMAFRAFSRHDLEALFDIGS